VSLEFQPKGDSMKSITRITSIAIALLLVFTAAFAVSGKKAPVRRLIASFTSHPVSGLSTITTGGKVKHENNGNHFGQIASLLGFTASAQNVVTPSIQPQSFEGLCSTVPPGQTTTLLGAGRWDDSFCGSHWQNLSIEGAPVFMDGTLTHLIVFVGGTGTADTDGVADVLIYRGGTFVDSGFTCTVGLNTRCDMVGIFPLVDNDQIIPRFNAGSGNFHNVRVIVTKE
jgi:hypothetical protein